MPIMAPLLSFPLPFFPPPLPDFEDDEEDLDEDGPSSTTKAVDFDVPVLVLGLFSMYSSSKK